MMIFLFIWDNIHSNWAWLEVKSKRKSESCAGRLQSVHAISITRVTRSCCSNSPFCFLTSKTKRHNLVDNSWVNISFRGVTYSPYSVEMCAHRCFHTLTQHFVSAKVLEGIALVAPSLRSGCYSSGPSVFLNAVVSSVLLSYLYVDTFRID